jgi:hypothetical protein
MVELLLGYGFDPEDEFGMGLGTALSFAKVFRDGSERRERTISLLESHKKSRSN